jgi:hypothetical protein
VLIAAETVGKQDSFVAIARNIDIISFQYIHTLGEELIAIADPEVFSLQ